MINYYKHKAKYSAFLFSFLYCYTSKIKLTHDDCHPHIKHGVGKC